MSTNLMKQYQSLLNDAVLDRAANIVDGEKSAVKKALRIAGGAVIGMCMDKACHSHGAQILYDMLDDHQQLDNLEEQIMLQSALMAYGASINDYLFGSKALQVSKYISNDTQLGHGACNTLLDLSCAMVSSLLIQEKSSGMTLVDFFQLLAQQAPYLEQHMPWLSALLGINSPAMLSEVLTSKGSATGTFGAAGSLHSNEKQSGIFFTLVLPMLTAGLLVLVLFLLLRSCYKVSTEQQAQLLNRETSIFSHTASAAVSGFGKQQIEHGVT